MVVIGLLYKKVMGHIVCMILHLEYKPHLMQSGIIFRMVILGMA